MVRTGAEGEEVMAECDHNWVPATIDKWIGQFCTRCCARKNAEPEVTEGMLNAGVKAYDEPSWGSSHGRIRLCLAYRAMRRLEPVPIKMVTIYDDGVQHRRKEDGEIMPDSRQGVRWVDHHHFHRRSTDGR